MDTSKSVEELRSALKKMSRAEVRALAAEAGLAASTVEKFRLNRIHEPRLSKLDALRAALKRSARRDKVVAA
jgi:transcriptional regulator with XRE-family HTH domain